MSDFFSNLSSGQIRGFGNLAGGLIGSALNPQPTIPEFTSNMQNPYFYQGQYQGQADQQLGQNFAQFNQYNPYLSMVPGLQSYYSQMQSNPYSIGGNGQTNMSQPGFQMPSYQQGANQAGYMSWDQAGRYGSLANQGSGLSAYGFDAVQNALQNIPGLNSQSVQQMLSGAGQAGSALTGVGNQTLSNAGSIPGITQSTLGDLPRLSANYAQPLAQFAGQGASGLNQLAGQTTQGLMPYAQQTAGQLPGMANQYVAPGNAAASSVLNTAFDPQNDLYNKSFQQNQEQTRAALASRGLNFSGVGAGAEIQSNQDFNTNWRDKLLNRQTQGLGAYEAASGQNYATQAGSREQGLSSLLSASAGTFTPYQSAYSSGVSGLNSAATTGYGIQSDAATRYLQGTLGGMQLQDQLGQSGAASIAQGSAMPYNAETNRWNNYLTQFGGLGTIGQQFGQIGQGSSGLSGTSTNNYLQGGAAPYQASTNILGNNYLGASNYLNAATSGNNINQSQNQTLLNYLGLGNQQATSYAGALNDRFKNLYTQNQNNAAGAGDFFGDALKLGMSFL